MKKFFRENSLSTCFALLFVMSMFGQAYFGYQEYLKELSELGTQPVTPWQYLSSGHFLQTTFENWESEFLQMALFVVLTIFLQQKGSSESKDFDKEEAVEREPDATREGAPWPVRKGGWILSLYKHSLSIVLAIFFLASLAGHFYGSLKDENTQRSLRGLPHKTAANYIADSRFWFESFQNWQSEFLSIFAIVMLSVFLRQKGSSQSKPVDAPNRATGG